MPDNFEELFKKVDVPEPPAGLSFTIIHRIERREARIAGIKIAASGTVFGGSVWMITAGAASFGASAAQSGFLQFGSVFFSDFGAAAANFSNSVLSLVESFPMLPAAMVLGGMVGAVWSLGTLLDETKTERKPMVRVK